MAANYWDSTQRRHWQFTRDQLSSMRQRLDEEDATLVQTYSLPSVRYMSIFFNQIINKLGKRLGVRQQALATAQIYTKRFYIRVQIRRTNPYLVIATAVYLACKMEECPQHIRLVVSEARLLWPTEFLGLDTSKLGECEFYMISELNSQLIIHQPYRTLTALQGDLQLTTDESSMAWSVINDSYMTDLPLLYPPHIIAVTAILLGLVCKPLAPGANPGGVNGQGSGAGQGTSSSSATSGSSTIKQAAAVLSQAQIQGSSGAPLSGGAAGGQGPAHMAGQGQKERAPGNGKITRFASWLADSNIELEAIVDTTQELISFYEEHEQYVDVRQREVMNRFVKARGFEK